MPNPRVSVVMAAYNHAGFVQRSIDSVLGQTFSDFEFLGADDGSTDGTYEVMARTTDSRVKFWSGVKNRGACVTMNEVIGRTCGEYIAVINSDDEFVPNKLALQVAYLDAHPGVGAVFGRVQFIDELGIDLPPSPAWNDGLFPALELDCSGWIRRIITKGNCFCHPTILIRRSCYERVGLYDARLASLPDQDMWLRLLLAGISISVLDVSLLRFRVLNGERNASAGSESNLNRHIYESDIILEHFEQPEIRSRLAQFFPELKDIRDPVQGFADLMSHSLIPGQRLWGIRKRYQLLPGPKLLGQEEVADVTEDVAKGSFTSLNRDAGKWLGKAPQFFTSQIFWAYGKDDFVLERSASSRHALGTTDVTTGCICCAGHGAIRLRIDPSEQAMHIILRSIVLSRNGVTRQLPLDQSIQVSGTARLLSIINGVIEFVSIGTDPQIILNPIDFPGHGDITVSVNWTVESLDGFLERLLPKDPSLLADVITSMGSFSARQLMAEREALILRRRIAQWDVLLYDVLWGLVRLTRLSLSRPMRLLGLMIDFLSIKWSRRFDGMRYLTSNDDVAESGEDPLVHYLVVGVNEGRKPEPYFNADDYILMAEDKISEFRDPYAHWIRQGCPEIVPNICLPAVSRIKGVAQGVSIVIPTLNGGELFQRSLKAIRSQVYEGPIQLVVVDSASEDGTDTLAEHYGAEVCRIARKDFHHARTRQKAFGLTVHPNLVYFVQDAIPVDDQWLKNLVESLHAAPGVKAVYGQQLPHHDADLFARFETMSHSEYLGNRRRIQKASISGIERGVAQALFRRRFDNVCGGYRREAIQQCPFPDVPFAEDLAWASQAIAKGWSILFDPDVQVFHSHNRPPGYRMRRAFVDSVCSAKILNIISLKVGPAYRHVHEFERLAEMARSLESALVHACRCPGGLPRIQLLELTKALLQLPGVTDGWGRFMVGHAAQVLFKIGRKFPLEKQDQYESCVFQAVHSAHGLACGSILAMHDARGGAPEAVTEYLAPLFKGV